MNEKELTIMVLVKAAPIVTAGLEESVCVAGMTLGEAPQWVRLHPVPFRDLDDDKAFRKYQVVDLLAIRSRRDRRPESWKPIADSIRPQRTVGTEHGWSERRLLVAQLGERTMCEMNRANEPGSGPDNPSLAVVRTRQPPELRFEPRPKDEVKRSQQRADRADLTPSLFRDGPPPKPLEIMPWKIKYRYHCLEPSCGRHEQSIIDWELVALWRRVRHRDDWRELIRKKFIDEMWAPDRDTVLFVGNQEQRPWGFLVLGVFWPPRTPIQPSLLS